MIQRLLSAAAFAACMGLPLLAPSEASAGKWVKCANEGNRCYWKGGGQKRVRYGTGGSYRFRAANSGIICANANFGDPAKFRRKGCWYYQQTIVYSRCANEGQRCRFSGTKTVRYGIAGKYRYRKFAGGVICANANFGDPAPGLRKVCSVGILK